MARCPPHDKKTTVEAAFGYVQNSRSLFAEQIQQLGTNNLYSTVPGGNMYSTVLYTERITVLFDLGYTYSTV